MGTGRCTYKNLSEFIQRLEADGELLRVKDVVDPILHITEIADRMSKLPNGGKALLFENVVGSRFPLLINGFGSAKRMALALGVDDVEEIKEQVEKLLNIAPPESLADKMKMLPVLFEMAKFPPKKSGGFAPCQEVVCEGDDVDLSILPALKCWPEDAGRFITFPLVFTKSLSGVTNLGMYRMQIFNKNETGMHWHIHKDGAHQFHEYRKAGKRMEVAVCIGSDPVVTYAATAPLPRGVDELLLAGLIRKKPVTLAKCKTVDLFVPADAEFVLEGYVDPSESLRTEGPFGDHTGYYSLASDYPVFHVTAVTHRKTPTYFTTIVGKPPMEDCYMAHATARIFLPMLQKVLPEVKDYDLPWEGVFHNCVITAVEKEFPAGAQRVMNAMWGTGQMSFAKMILAVDEDTDVTDYKTVLKTFLNNFDASEDIFLSQGVLDVLDHSAPKPLRGSKLGLDATARLPMEADRKFPVLSDVDEDAIGRECRSHGIKSFSVIGAECKNRIVVCSIDKKRAGEAFEKGGNLLSGIAGGMANILVIVDGDIDPSDHSVVAWKFFNNTDPKRDITVRGDRVIVDATRKLPGEGHKREWPDEIEMDDETKKSVDGIWAALRHGASGGQPQHGAATR